MRKLILLFILFSLSLAGQPMQILCGSDFANNSPSLQEMVEPLLKLQREGKLDGTVLIAKGSGQVFILHNSGDGLDPCQGMRGQYYLASTGKQMIAVAVLKAIYDKVKGNSEEICVDQVKLELNKPLLHFLPANDKIWRGQVPEWANKVTIHQLLTHQSGIPDFTRFPAFFEKNSAGEQFEESPHETWEFLKIIEGQSLDFEPGTSESYSNTGYTLIKEVIRAVTQMPAEDYMNQNLFQTLGMNDTLAVKEGNWLTLRQQEPTNCLLKPLRYDPTSKSQSVYLPQHLPDAGGGGPTSIISTAIDLLKWNLALHRDHCCLPAALYELVIAPHSKGPSGFGYGYGIARDKTYFGTALNHSAGSARMIYVPSKEISLIVLTHVSYDWDRVEEIIQDRIKVLESSSKNKQEAEQQAVKEVLEQYPLANRGYEAIVAIFNQFLGLP